MKTITKIATIALLASVTYPAFAQQPGYQLQGGPGIVTAVSTDQGALPPAAQQFLQRVYSRVAVGPIMHNTVKNTYTVTLGNDVQVTFTADGRVDDIQAPYPDTLYGRAIEAVLPAKAYKHLEEAGLLDKVTGIKNAAGRGLRVQMLNEMPPEMLFDVDGLFIIVDD